MGIGVMLLPLLLLLFYARAIDAFVYSCEEVKYRLINADFEKTTKWACIQPQEGFTNWEQLKKISFDKYSRSFADIAAGRCLASTPLSPWKIVAETGSDLSCDQAFTLILTSEADWILFPRAEVLEYAIPDNIMPFAVPQTGMWIHITNCTGVGNFTVRTGAGDGSAEESYVLKSWPSCDSVPTWIFSFDNVITIEKTWPLQYRVECSSDMGYRSPVTVAPGDRITILSSGRSDDLQNLARKTPPGAYMVISDGRPEGLQLYYDVNINMQLTFDSGNPGYIHSEKSRGFVDVHDQTGTFLETSCTRLLRLEYRPKQKHASEIWNSNDSIIINVSIAAQTDRCPTTPAPTTTTATSTTSTTTTPGPTATASLPHSLGESAYCNCGVDKFGFPIGWKYNDIWLDVVVILDTSEAMGNMALADAGALIESFISDGFDVFLVTDPNAPFYTRVGVISMADRAEVLYNLNMTKSDRVQGRAAIKKGVLEIDVVAAYEAALNMFNDGWKSRPDRVNTRQVIYYMTDSDPKNNLNGLNQFKTSQGVIIVNNFLQEGEVELPGLRALASDGYYFPNINYVQSLQYFCKANCFCKSDKNAYGGADPAIKASGGCYHPAPAGVPFNKASNNCAKEGGMLATIHDHEKGRFLNQLMSTSKANYFWIGNERSDDGAWRWVDESIDSYTNWGANEPSNASVAKCAYVDKTTSQLTWAAGNCQMGLPYVCQHTPCSAGYNNC